MKKLVMVSVYCNGSRGTAFVYVEPDADGRIRVSEDELFRHCLPNASRVRGVTWSHG